MIGIRFNNFFFTIIAKETIQYMDAAFPFLPANNALLFLMHAYPLPLSSFPIFSPQSPIFKQLCKKLAQAPQGFPASHFLSSITIKDFPKKCVFASWSAPEKKTDADFNTQSAEFPHEPEKNEKPSEIENHLSSM
jgi:hypothetical protein